MKNFIIDHACIPYPRKNWYRFISFLYLLGFSITTVFLYDQSKSAAIVYLLLYLISTLLHAYVCSYSPCPYVGTYCPGAFGWFLVGKLARVFQRLKLKKSEILINVSFLFIMLSVLGIIVLPVYFYYTLGIIYSIAYVIFIVIYFLTFVLSICSHCAGRANCPTAKLSGKLNKSIFNKDIFKGINQTGI